MTPRSLTTVLASVSKHTPSLFCGSKVPRCAALVAESADHNVGVQYSVCGASFVVT